MRSPATAPAELFLECDRESVSFNERAGEGERDRVGGIGERGPNGTRMGGASVVGSWVCEELYDE